MLSNHYEWLKKNNLKVKVLCFNYKKFDRIFIDRDDLFEIKGNNIIKKIINLRLIIMKLNPKYIYCHSGQIEIYLSLIFKRIKYSIFYHHPSSMTLNDFDKFSFFYWKRFKRFITKILCLIKFSANISH